MTCRPVSSDSLIVEADREACLFGLSAMDALHVAAAVSVGAEELVTTEGPDRPIHRTGSVKIVSVKPR